jgi:hypothetical protein
MFKEEGYRLMGAAFEVYKSTKKICLKSQVS